MPLFHPHVIEKYMGSVRISQEHKLVLNKWNKYINNESIRKKKETALYDSFSQGILQKILQYRLALDDPENYTLEQNTTIGKGEVEYALGRFGSNINTEILAPLELKSIKTNLDLIIPSRNKSPVQQAWDYATETKGTKWVLVSNYLELRLYAVGFGKKDYEVFKLDNLTDPYEYAHFLLLLSADNLLNGFTHNLLTQSELRGKEITKVFYSEYKNLRHKIITDLKKQNPTILLHKIIRYTQIILDRVLFAAFAESKGLLPINTIKETCTPHRFNPRPIWENFKGLFNAIDKGDTSLHIPEFNGGLFEYDSIPNSLKVSNRLCEEFKKLCEYDFSSEVSVNILGRILEQSIIDLEEIKKIGMKGKNLTERKKTKRKKEGVFYTPNNITHYIVEQAIGRWLNDRKKDIGFEYLPLLTDKDYSTIKRNRKGKIIYNDNVRQHIQAWENYKKVLSNIKILDPACGSGAFLIEAYDYLRKEGEALNFELSKLKGGQLDILQWDKHILTNNIYGIDINHEAVEITKLSIWLKTANTNEKLTNLNDNIKCGDSLIDDITIAKDLAFEWKNEFPDIMKSGGFDIIIGNPPYVFAREKIPKVLKEFFSDNYLSAQYQINTYQLFVEKALQLLKRDNGYLNFIVPNTWLMVSSAKRLRKIILEHCTINRITNLTGLSFENANVETIIIDLKYKKIEEKHRIEIYINNPQNREFILFNTKQQESFNVNPELAFQIFSNERDTYLLDKIQNKSTILDTITTVKSGLMAYEEGKGDPIQTRYDIKNRIYDYDHKHDRNTYKYLDGKDVFRYYHNCSGTFLKYGKNLAAPRTFNIFHDESLIIREITGKYPRSIIATYSPQGEVNLFNRSNIAIMPKLNSEISLKYILAILNSKLISYYFMLTTAKAVRKMFPKIILIELRKFPIKTISKDKQFPIIEMVDIMISKNKNLSLLSMKFINLLKAEFSLQKLTPRLENWYDHTFDVFLIELRKKKVFLNIKQKEQWLLHFDGNKSEIQKIKTILDQTDNLIDQSIYKLYELTDQEIEIIESYKSVI